MPKLLRFTVFSVRDLLISSGPALLLIGLAVLLIYYWADPNPPKRVTLATGQENGAYDKFGKQYQASLKKQHIQLTLKPSKGSQENLQSLHHRLSGVDLAFVQSGSTDEEAAQRQGLVSLGSLFKEPVWIFYKAPHAITDLKQFRAMKMNIGQEGTGVPRLLRQLLGLNGVEPKEINLSDLDDTPATVALLEGKIDALVFISAPEAPLVQMLLQTPGVQTFDFSQAEAYSRHLPFLSHLILPRGIVDFGRNIPAQDIHLIAPTATLVGRSDIHPALVQLFVQAASKIHGGAGWFHHRGEFPSANYTEIPVTPQAERFYQNGVPWMQHYLPFGIANFFDRMWVFIVAFGALVLPLSRILSPLYNWRIRSRVYRWYGQLRIIEQALEQGGAQDYTKQYQQLIELEERVNQTSIPLSFADGLYDLRAHIHLVREQVRQMMAENKGAEK